MANLEKIRARTLDKPLERKRKNLSGFRLGLSRRFGTALDTAAEKGNCGVVEFLDASRLDGKTLGGKSRTSLQAASEVDFVI